MWAVGGPPLAKRAKPPQPLQRLSKAKKHVEVQGRHVQIGLGVDMKMARRFVSSCSLLLLVTLMSSFLYCEGRYIEEYCNAEHWDDNVYIQNRHRIARSHALTAFYAPSCAQELNQKFGELSSLPPDHVLVIGRHDYESRKREHWYEWSSDYNLYSRLPPQQRTGCLTIVFHAQANVSQYEVWDKSGSLSDWVWAKMGVRVTFRNTLEKPVTLFWRAVDGKLSEVGRLQPGSARGFNTHFSHRFIAKSEDGRFVNGYDIRFDMPSFSVDITQSQTAHSVKKWVAAADAELQEEWKLLTAMWWSHARRHILNYKQCPMMPGFTEHGFLKRKMPKEIFERLSEWYHKNKDIHRQQENWPKGGTQINFDQVTTSMIHLPESEKRWVADRLAPILEAWSGQKLDYQMMYGIREYYDGSMLMTHVDRVETHVVSCILQIYQEVDVDWDLHVVAFNGTKLKIPMEAGDMVLYESTKLIHGRPVPLNGSVYANAFLHYRPTKGWAGVFKYTPDNVIHVGPQQVPARPEHILGKPWTPGSLGFYPASHAHSEL